MNVIEITQALKEHIIIYRPQPDRLQLKENRIQKSKLAFADSVSDYKGAPLSEFLDKVADAFFYVHGNAYKGRVLFCVFCNTIADLDCKY
jgi:hypothetical protein